ncbi:HIT-like domain-containing protein [Catenaria anguillulae PL171]|uniref:HIT-like domain-containing protein n=1 Tax=Catenaria anguillulae PL171 TaxID=765915 RepID=A0A1Y2HX04_9FUNG|nr:HIT-like domain-containing protein [Catenaria anguillulae PL171]
MDSTAMTPAALRSKISAVYQAAQVAGHVIFAPTTLRTIHDHQLDLDFHVLVAPSLAKKDKPKPSDNAQVPTDRKKPKFNPFLPYDRNQYVADLSPTHVLLLNKFPVIAEHVLVVTKEFLLQDEPIDVADFDALIPVMQAMADSNPLAFYNCGANSGSSQPHRHIQVIPQQQPCPISKLVLRNPGSSRIPGLDYVHHLTPFSSGFPTSPTTLHSAYTSSLAALSRLMATPHDSRETLAHNVLITSAWMMVIPRLRERTVDGWMGVNAVGYTGSVLVTSDEQVRELEQRGGVLPVLVECGHLWKQA